MFNKNDISICMNEKMLRNAYITFSFMGFVGTYQMYFNRIVRAYQVYFNRFAEVGRRSSAAELTL